MSDLAEADPAGSAAAAEPAAPRLLRDRSGSYRVTNIELFFDLVYVFAVTQLSHYLLGHATVPGALQAGLLLVMIWLVWIYTTWVTNWLDPDQMAVRLLLVLLMLVSLAMSVSLPRAFEDLGLWVGDPGQAAGTAAVWMILGGPALFLAGHAAFKLVVWRVVSWPRLAGIAVLALLALAADAIPALALAACAAVLVTAVAATDRLSWLPRPAELPGPAGDPAP